VDHAAQDHLFRRYPDATGSNWHRAPTPLVKTWPGPRPGMTAISFVFNDTPYELSPFIIDAVVMFDRGARGSSPWRREFIEI
jgi:hypothetical protein